MALAIKFYPNSAMKSIEALQKGITKSMKDPSQATGEGNNMFASVFALRQCANATRGKKSTLKVPVTKEQYEQAYNTVMQGKTFQNFLKKHTTAELAKMCTEGHGGAAEDAFKTYVMEHSTLPTDVQDRWMPTAKERIEQQQKKLEGFHPSSDEAVAAYAEIFRCRRAVKATRNSPGTLEPHINGAAYAEQPDLSACETFKEFVRDKGSKLKKTAVTGHGGAAEEMFKEHVLQCDRLPTDVPVAYMPEALKRTETLQEKLRSTTEPRRQAILFTELMATREAVGAERGKKASLERIIEPKAMEEAYTKWASCTTFQDYLKDNPEQAREAAAKGHGGALSDRFKEHLASLDHIPEDVPKEVMPTALEHIEALQKKYKGIGYFDTTDEKKLTMAAEIMAAREAVGAVRGDKDSLKTPIDPEKLKTSFEKWKSCKAFADFVKNEEQKVYDGAVAGHGGAMGDKFKEYVVSRDQLEADIPGEYMPTARVRTEALQKKLRESSASPAENEKLYAELMATRSSVGAVRGKKGSLDAQLDPKALDADRQALLGSEAFKNFLADPSQSAAIRKAALDGHGGALEDSFKEYVKSVNVIPKNTPERYMPTALERTEALQKKIEAGNFENDAERASVYVELMATRASVAAVRGKKDSLNKTVNSEALDAEREKWAQCESFKNFVCSEDARQYGAIRKAALAGHGGALLDHFKETVNRADYIPEDLPQEIVPNADTRIEAIQKRLNGDELFPEDKPLLYAQILAARSSVGAVRGKKDSLQHRIDPTAVNEKADTLIGSAAFQAFVEENEEKLDKLARSGHGGEMEDAFKKHVAAMKELPSDVSKEYMPTAVSRIENLQAKFKTREFMEAGLEEQTAYYAELMGARRSVGAERNKKELLNANVDPKKASEISQKLKDCQTFKDFIKKDPGAARNAATSGHGGALEDAFKKYVLTLSKIPGDVPKDYMPNARERTEALQDKIKSREFAAYSPSAKVSLYRELIATRTAADSMRGDKKTLDITVDPEKLEANREKLANCRAVTDFLEDADERVLRDAATAGHGGALEDKLKAEVVKQTLETGKLPAGLPDRHLPSAADLQEEFRNKLIKDNREGSSELADINKPDYMRRIACSMYLFKLQKESQRNGTKPNLDPELMERNVSKLMGSQAFKNMFRNPGSAYSIASKIGAKRMSDVFTRYAENQGRFELEGHQPVLQNQPVQNQRQNQQNANEAEQAEPQANRNNRQPQRRNRANSVQINQNPQLEL